MNTKQLTKYLPAIATTMIVIASFNLLKTYLPTIHIKSSDLPNIVTMGVGVLGLVPSWWQARISAKQAGNSTLSSLIDRLSAFGDRFDAKLQDLGDRHEERLGQLTERCNLIDDRQNQEISTIRRELVAIITEGKVMQSTYAALINEMFAMRKELADHMAQLTLASGVADLRMQLESMRSQIRELKKPIS
jgi:hypothetical protein